MSTRCSGVENKLKIILVNKFHYIKGGTETYVFSLAEELRRQGHEVHFFAMRDPQNEACEDEKYFVTPRDYNDSKQGFLTKANDAINLIWSREARDKFEQMLRDIKPDVVHLNLVHRQISLSILDAPSLKGIPVIYTSHEYIMICPAYTMLNGRGEVCEECLGGHFWNCVRNKCIKASVAKSVLAFMESEYIELRKYYKRFNMIIAPSNFMATKLAQGGIAKQKIVVMKNFLSDYVDGCTFNEADHGDGYFLYFGRLSKEKGIEVLIDAYLKYLNNGEDEHLRLLIVGDGPDRTVLEKRAAENRLTRNIFFTGRKQGEELKSLVSRAKFSIVPSVWYENMPYSILESLAVGTPVIVSRTGGMSEVVKDGSTGYLINPGDVNSLQEVLGRATHLDRESYRLMQKACSEYVKKEHSPASYTKRLLTVYGTAIKELQG